MVVGVTGRIGSGKSTLCRILSERHGCPVIDADAFGHDALSDPTIRARIAERFGSSIIDDRIGIDRPALARIVFADGSALRDLEAIIHPWILRMVRKRLADLRATGQAAIVLVDAAVLLSWIGQLPLDRIVWVHTAEEVAIGRLHRRGVSEEQARERMLRQRPEEEFRRHADFVVTNSGGLDELECKAERLWESLIGNRS